MTMLNPEYIVDAKGRKTKVILPIAEYERLLEDLHDLAVLAEQRDEETISLDELKDRMKRHAALQRED